MSKHIVIVGGGFGGIRTALDLACKNLKDVKITLISDKPHFEYYPAIYKAVIGRSPLEICIQLSDIFKNKKNVEIIIDKIKNVDSVGKKITGENGAYVYDYLVLALGSETVFFGIPNIANLAFGFKSINEAVKLNRHIHEMFDAHHENIQKEELVANLHMLIVGGGASGVEIAGELAVYLKKLSKKHGLDPSLATIDIIEAAPRILFALPEQISVHVTKQLRSLGINIFVNRALVNEDLEQVYMKDMSLKTKTVIWTAGIKVNSFYKDIPGIVMNKNSRVVVDEFLSAKGLQDIFIIGDAADTPYSGLAQTAIYDGGFVSKNLVRKIKGDTLKIYVPKKVSYVVPVGPGWAAAKIGNFFFYGFFASKLREVIDFMFFLSILPFKKALFAFQSGKKMCESCETCLKEE
ncbi:MAG: FAD-dependent oxidoreductase [Patescibacteria group bacterium]